MCIHGSLQGEGKGSFFLLERGVGKFTTYLRLLYCDRHFMILPDRLPIEPVATQPHLDRLLERIVRPRVPFRWEL